jgi:hypothetical protein
LGIRKISRSNCRGSLRNRPKEVIMARGPKGHGRELTDEILDKIVEYVHQKCPKAVRRIKRLYDPLDPMEQSVVECVLKLGSASPLTIAGWIDEKREKVEAILDRLVRDSVIEYDENERCRFAEHIDDWASMKEAAEDKAEALRVHWRKNRGTIINKLLSEPF